MCAILLLMSLDIVSVSSIMIRDVKTVERNNSLKHACRVMQTNKIASVIVVASDKGSVGILRETLLRTWQWIPHAAILQQESR